MNVAKSKVLLCEGENRTVCDVKIQVERMEQVSEFNYLGCMVNDIGREKKCENKVMNVRWVAGAIKELVNEKELSLEYASVFVLKCWNWVVCVLKENARSKIREVQIDNLLAMIEWGVNDRMSKLVDVHKGVN